MSDRACCNPSLNLCPSIKLLECGNRPIPRCGRDASTDILAMASPMKRGDVTTLRFPDTVAARLLKKANPDHNVVAIGAKRMPRLQAVQRQVQ